MPCARVVMVTGITLIPFNMEIIYYDIDSVCKSISTREITSLLHWIKVEKPTASFFIYALTIGRLPNCQICQFFLETDSPNFPVTKHYLQIMWSLFPYPGKCLCSRTWLTHTHTHTRMVSCVSTPGHTFYCEHRYKLACTHMHAIPSCEHPWYKDIYCNVDTACDPECILRILNNPWIRTPSNQDTQSPKVVSIKGFYSILTLGSACFPSTISHLYFTMP